MVAREQFIGEVIQPIREGLDFSVAAPGEPALPRLFHWRDQTVEVTEIVRRWKTHSDCRSGSPERYVRKHWYEIRTLDNRSMQIYFERQPRSARQRKARWWLFSVTTNVAPPAG